MPRIHITKKLKNKVNLAFSVVQAKKIAPFVKPYWKMALLGVLITIPVGGMDALIAWALKPYMDVVLIEKSVKSASFVPLLIVVFSLVQSLLNFAATYINAWTGQKITNGLKEKLYGKLLRNDVAFFDKTTSGDILMRFSADADMACSGLVSNVKLFMTRFFSSVSLICVLFYNSWQLAIVALIFMFSAFVPLSRVRKKLKDIMTKSLVAGGAISTKYNEAFSGNRVITSYNLYKRQKSAFAENLNELFKLGMKITKRTGMISPMMHFLISSGIAGVVWYGSYLIVSEQITPGNFVSFIAALLMLYTPIKAIGNTYSAVQMSLLAMERVFGLLESTPDIVNAPDAKPIKGIKHSIVYKNVGFTYDGVRKILTGINAEFKVGHTIALVGNSGGGKTTLVNLLPRFYDVTEGEILIDGVNIKDIELDSLRNNIAVVFQDNFLFSGTIRENIMLGKMDASQQELDKAVDDACLREFIDSLPEGVDTYIGERGILLSGGQKQRIGIARAFIKNAPVVILDEATSSLDNQSEAIVQQALDNLMENRTVFVIAHRLSTIRNADRILVVNRGKIVEEGSHQELMKLDKGVYKALYNAQMR